MSTELIAKIKKIDINNKVLKGKWEQTISITLSDITVNDTDLISLADYKPNEEILVSLEKLQISIDDIERPKRLRQGIIEEETEEKDSLQNDKQNHHQKEDGLVHLNDIDEEEDEEFFAVEEIEEGEELPEGDRILKTFDFS